MQYMRERTNTAAALRVMRENVFNTRNGARNDARDVAFIITDGNSNINSEDTIAEAIKVIIMSQKKVVNITGRPLRATISDLNWVL